MLMAQLKKYLLYGIPIIIVGAILIYFSEIVGYIVMAWVVSMIGAPLNNFLSKFLSKGMAAGLTLVVFSLLLLIVVRILVPPLVNQAKNLAGLDYEKMISGLEEPIQDVNNWLIDKGLIAPEIIEEIPEETSTEETIQTSVIKLDSILRTEGDTLSDDGLDLVINIIPPSEVEVQPQSEDSSTDLLLGVKNNIFEKFNPSKIPKLLGSFVGFFGNILIALLSIFFIAFFFLKEKGLFTKMVSFLVPNKHEGKTQHAIDESSKLLVRYFVGLLLQVLVITLVTTLVLKLFGMKNALLMAFCFAIFNLIPYVGPILGNLFGVLIVISSNLDFGFYDVMLPKIIKTIVIFAIMQMLDNFLLQPNIFSRSVKAHPLEIFIIVLMGAKVGGVAGMVLAIPAYTVLRVMAKVYLSEFEVVKRLTAGM